MHVLILGATSDMATALAREFAKNFGATFTLACRNVSDLERLAADFRVQYDVNISLRGFEATDFQSHADFYKSLDPRPDVVVVAFGYLGDQTDAEKDFGQFKKIVDVNFLGAVSILEMVAADFETVRRGSIICISSVAGERGRQSNYAYGSAKGGLTTYLSGLRHRLHCSGVSVTTVLPGFVRTKMTRGMKLPKMLTAAPEAAAKDMYNAWQKKKPICYTRWFWRYIMMIIRSIPERFFVRTKL